MRAGANILQVWHKHMTSEIYQMFMTIIILWT